MSRQERNAPKADCPYCDTGKIWAGEESYRNPKHLIDKKQCCKECFVLSVHQQIYYRGMREQGD